MNRREAKPSRFLPKFGEDERLQALRPAVAVPEALLELAGGGPAAGIDFTAFLQPDLCETDHDSAEQAQRKGCLGVSDPAVIFTQRLTSSMTPEQRAAMRDKMKVYDYAHFDSLVAAVEYSHRPGLQIHATSAHLRSCKPRALTRRTIKL